MVFTFFYVIFYFIVICENADLFTPINFKRELVLLHENFSGSSEHDSGECVITIVNHLSVSVPEINDIFNGKFNSRLECSACLYSSNKEEAFKSIELSIEKMSKLKDCINFFLSRDFIGCPKCKKNTCTKQFSINNFPNILVLCLKRFSFSQTATKLSHIVHFPLELTLSSEDDSKLHVYELIAVSNHIGNTIDTGHYNSYCKVKDINKWYSFDDSKVTEIQETTVVSNLAYLLFYQKVI